jgi:hypothetical protein
VQLIPWLLAAEQEHCPRLASELVECGEADKNCFKNTIIDDKNGYMVTTPKLNNNVLIGATLL